MTSLAEVILPASFNRKAEISRSKSAPPAEISQPAHKSTFVRPGAALAKSRIVFFSKSRDTPPVAGATSVGVGVGLAGPPSEVKLIAMRDSFLINGKIFQCLGLKRLGILQLL